MNEYPIIGIVAARGSGKTLTMTVLASAYASAGMNVYANYNLYGIPYEHIEFNDIVDYPEYIHDGVIFIDEAHIGTDAYAFFSKRVKGITKFSTQTRKRHLIFIYSTQVFTQVAKRLRDLTDYIIYCQEMRVKGIIALSIHDRNPDDSFIHSRILDGRSFFENYDTDEIIELK